jgi:hypothetical protein
MMMLSCETWKKYYTHCCEKGWLASCLLRRGVSAISNALYPRLRLAKLRHLPSSTTSSITETKHLSLDTV